MLVCQWNNSLRDHAQYFTETQCEWHPQRATTIAPGGQHPHAAGCVPEYEETGKSKTLRNLIVSVYRFSSPA